MTKREADKLLHRCYRLLRNPEYSVSLRKISPGVSGIAVPWLNSIVVNPHKDALRTILHECIHLLSPDMSETNVLKAEAALAKHLSARQWKNLCYRVGLSF